MDTEKTNSEKKTKNSYVSTVGRRKEAIARIRLFSDDMNITVNGKPITERFTSAIEQSVYLKPFVVTQTLGKYGASIKVLGGGQSSQLGAIAHGLARALNKLDAEKFRSLLKKEGLLTRDPRAKETRKYGNAQKARAKKQSPKR